MANVRIETAGSILSIELARPDKKNALTREMYDAMSDALVRADAEAGVRVVLIHGSSECFTSGNDLKDFLALAPDAETTPASRFIRTISLVQKPVIAAVGGAAVGVGTTMLLHCDLVYATPEARFQMPFTSLGLVPEAGSSFLLPYIAGYQRAAELLLLGRPFDTRKALEAGFVTEVIPKEDLLEYARDAALGIAALPPAAVRQAKSLMKRRFAAHTADAIEEESRIFRACLGSPEAREAMSAFLEKRKPDFSRFG